MSGRLCILLFVLAAVLPLTRATAAWPGTYHPDRIPRDSLSKISEQRNQRLYDSIRVKSSRRAVPRLLYGWFFVRPRTDTAQNGRVLDENRALAAYAGKTIGDIHVERQQVFRSDGNWLRRTGNKLHALTEERVVRRDLLFKSGDTFDPQLIVRTKQLLRSRRYISGVEIAVRPDTLDTTRVDLLIRTRDSWTITVDGGAYSEGRTMVALEDANILGTGNMLKVKTNFSRRDFSYGGNEVEYEIPNVLGTFFTAEFAAGRAFYNSSVYLTGRYNHRRFLLRPNDVTANHHPSLHGHDAALFGAGIYREKFLTANMIYGFGSDEYLATGYKAEIVSGYSWGEFNDEVYLGLSYRTGGFRRAGYIMGGLTLGSYIEPLTGKWNHSAVDIDLRWFSHLFIAGRSRLRQFLMLNYTHGWNRGTGNNESIRFTRRNGLQALKERILGTNRAVLNTETVLFTPWQPLGFRIAFFGFADLGLIGYSPNAFKNDFFASLGGGIRIKNERLIFSTVQIRLGVAFNKNGLADSEYFRLSNSTRLEQYRYRPTRPEIVGFE